MGIWEYNNELIIHWTRVEYIQSRHTDNSTIDTWPNTYNQDIQWMVQLTPDQIHTIKTYSNTVQLTYNKKAHLLM